MSSIHKEHIVRAVVAGTRASREADLVVSLFTPAGRMSAYAYGAKKSRTRFLGALDLFATIDAELCPQRKSAFGMPTLRSAVVRTARLGLRDDLGKIALGAYVVELVTTVGPEGTGAGELFELLTRTLDQLVHAPASSVLRRTFELRLLLAMGCQPELSGCVVCGSDQAQGRWFLDLERGGLLCSRHREDAKEVGPHTLAWMRGALRMDASETSMDHRPPLTHNVDDDIASRAAHHAGSYIDAFFSGHIDRPLRSKSMLVDCGLA
ncbi:MAG: DNA repair protein RecO [Deltaproteobacteria bacterium]|nr:DNA repair protein RecO [Deltaproteobacteria bacterium]